ncbi:fluoride efflux transporter FluC [Arsenicicoccus dermatophilus]|uniref:fluoride efflux transporter FluC n=1 Tax=Arsenicicoccus dermatophilus TaxID=1076331 RepID=UPI001F4CB5A8|nr:CrcB family protein [Arsenicicoccus dermatophilus]MCH8612956.1 CrcB family protein [Arsenicicoccus dermatophilus]
MTPGLFLGVALAGGLGAALRLTVDTWVRERAARDAAYGLSAYGLGTLLINVAGSLALGLVVGLASRELLDPAWRLVLGTGLCGGFTTFSTASLDTARLVPAAGPGRATLHAAATLVLSLAAALLGLALAGA